MNELFDHPPDLDVTRPYDGPDEGPIVSEIADTISPRDELSHTYQQIVQSPQVSWETRYRMLERLGEGGQGVVYLAERASGFDVAFQLALKFYRPNDYLSVENYRSEMARIARVTMDVAAIQQDQVMDVYNVTEYRGLLVLAAEVVKGCDIRQLLTPSTLASVKDYVTPKRWKYINDVVITCAGFQNRFQPFVALNILRECLAGVAALHRKQIVHADLKPANVMVKLTGNCKIIDLGSAFRQDAYPSRPTWTKRYAAVEVLKRSRHTPQSDIASLGYVLLEILTGKYPYAATESDKEIIELKEDLWKRKKDLLPPDLARNDLIVELLSKMIAPDPEDRFETMEEVGHVAQEIQEQLVKSNMSTDAAMELRYVMEDLEAVREAAEKAKPQKMAQ